MIIESGVILALGLLFTFMKLSWKKRMWMLSHPLAMDLFVFIALTYIHWGSFFGLMAAACGAMITSAMISLGRWVYGYQVGNLYYPGLRTVDPELLR